METLDALVTANGPPIDARPIASSVIEEYRASLPPGLIEHWVTVGSCGYAGGAFWIADPSDFKRYAAKIPKVSSATVVARTSFADLFLWSKSELYFYTPATSGLSSCGDDIVGFFNMFTGGQAQRDMWGTPMFKKAVKRLGVLAHDECYGYVPLPALGGSGEPDTLKKVKMIQHLEIIRQSLD